jgi:hypothetical protein
LSHAAGESGTAFVGQDTPGEDPIDPFEARFVVATVALIAFEPLFEDGMEGFRCFEWEAQLDRGRAPDLVAVHGISVSSRGRCDPE